MEEGGDVMEYLVKIKNLRDKYKSLEINSERLEAEILLMNLSPSWDTFTQIMGSKENLTWDAVVMSIK